MFLASFLADGPHAGDAVDVVDAGAPVDADVLAFLRPAQLVDAAVGEEALVHEHQVVAIEQRLVHSLAELDVQELVPGCRELLDRGALRARMCLYLTPASRKILRTW